MPPQDPTPQGPLDPSKGPGHTSEGTTPPQKPGIDPASVLLPKKETPGQNPGSAQRINAGALLAQEQQAAAEGLPKPEAAPQPGAPAAAPLSQKPAGEAKEDDSTVRSIETYQSDIERVVENKNVSVVSIAAAEAQRRGQNPQPGVAAQTSAASRNFWSRTAMFGGATLIGLFALGILVYVFTPHTVPEQAVPPAPFIAVDGTEAVVMAQNDTRDQFMNSLNTARQNVSLALGLIEQIVPESASTTLTGTANTPMDAQTFLSAIAPDIPAALLRNIEPQFLLGAHVYDGDQAFLILKVDDYETAYSGMLAWEPNLPADLAPLFNYTPPPHIPEEKVATITPPTTFLQTSFVDDIVDNHDARVLENSTGDVSLLWTFLDRNTLVITTNAATLGEIISRLTAAPVISLPTQ